MPALRQRLPALEGERPRACIAIRLSIAAEPPDLLAWPGLPRIPSPQTAGSVAFTLFACEASVSVGNPAPRRAAHPARRSFIASLIRKGLTSMAGINQDHQAFACFTG
jgi:hypothetical protein